MDDDKEHPINRWGAPQGDGLIHLNDLDFDFEDYFARYARGEMEEAEKEEYACRVMGMFCRDFFKAGGDVSALQFWVVNYIAEAMHQVLGGVPWNKVLSTPFDTYQSDFTPLGDRAMAIYCAVENARRGNPSANITDFIAAQAREHSVSYETARGDYYTMRAGIQMRVGVPKKFLKPRDDF